MTLTKKELMGLQVTKILSAYESREHSRSVCRMLEEDEKEDAAMLWNADAVKHTDLMIDAYETLEALGWPKEISRLDIAIHW